MCILKLMILRNGVTLCKAVLKKCLINFIVCVVEMIHT